MAHVLLMGVGVPLVPQTASPGTCDPTEKEMTTTMNSKSLRIVTATALSLVLAVPATVLAGGSKDAKDSHFENADKNNDGALTKDEVPPQRWQRLQNADANKDGKVTKDELTAFFKAKHDQRAQGKAGHGKPQSHAGHRGAGFRA